MEPILTPSEMEALLSPPKEIKHKRSVKPVDLVARDHQAFALLPKLQEVADRQAVQVGRICTQQLHTMCRCLPDPVEVVPAPRLPGLLEAPRFAFGLRINGVAGAGALTMDGSLGGAFVACQFGGDLKNVPNLTEPPTATERRTVGRVAASIIEALVAAIRPVCTLTAALEADDVPNILQAPKSSQAAVMMVLRVPIGERNAAIALVLETSAAGFRIAQRPGPRKTDTKDSPLRPHLDRVTVEAHVQLGTSTISVAEFLSLSVGDLLLLRTPVDASIPLAIEGIPKFLGKPTVHHGNLSLELSSPYKE